MAGSETKRRYRNNVSNPLPGFYRARVESNKDTEKLGRIQIRLPQCHGIPDDIDDNYLHSEDLPWAYPCISLGAGYDYGSYVIPCAGEYVWIAFEGGDPNSPIYFGSCYGLAPTSVKPMGSFIEGESTRTCVGSEGKWYAPAYQDDLPDGITPSTKTIYKSPKGATIEIEDADEHESLSLTDRLGQLLKFICPVTESMNTTNKSSRGKQSVIHNQSFTTTTHSYLSKTVIILKDLGGQLLRLVSTPLKSVYEMISQHGESHSGVVLTSEETKSGYKILAESGTSHTTVESTTEDSSVVITVAQGGVVQSQLKVVGDSVSIMTTNFNVSADNIHFSTSPTVSSIDTPDIPVTTQWADNHAENYEERSDDTDVR